MEFSRNPTERFKTLPAVYMAIKMSQLKVSLELNVHSAEEIEGKVQGGAVSKLRSTRYPRGWPHGALSACSHGVRGRVHMRLACVHTRSTGCTARVLVSSPPGCVYLGTFLDLSEPWCCFHLFAFSALLQNNRRPSL